MKNTGEVESEEVVQLYLKDVEASVDIPKWQLKGFKKVLLAPGQETEVPFEVSARDMALINEQGKRILEPGKFEVFIGGSQPDKRSQQLITNNVVAYPFDVKGSAMELEY